MHLLHKIIFFLRQLQQHRVLSSVPYQFQKYSREAPGEEKIHFLIPCFLYYKSIILNRNIVGSVL